jgi:large subunit ribosomal protein L4
VTVVSVVTPSGKGGKNVELPDEIFAVKVNIPLIHQVVVAQEAAARQGGHATKTRGMVRGGGKKPYRQKGTGRARQGSLRAPQYAGGGIAHGPVPRSYVQRTPKKMKAAALRGALSDRASHGRLSVVSGFVEGEQPSTASALAVLRAAVGEASAPLLASVLVIANADDMLTHKSLRNARGVRVLPTGQLNTRDVLVSDYVVFTQAALSEFIAHGTGAELVEIPAKAPAREKPAAAEKPAAVEKPAAAKGAAAKPAAAKGAAAGKAAAAEAAAAEKPVASAKPAAAKAAAAGKPAARATVAAEAAPAGQAPARTRAAKPPAKPKPAAKASDEPEDKQ